MIVTVITLVLASITAIGVWLGPKWTEQSRRRYEARQSHLAKLKNGVIRPLLNQIAHYYRPVCTNHESNIIGKSVLVNISHAPLTEFNKERQDQLSIYSIDDIVEDWQENDLMRDFDAKIPITHDNLVVDKDLYEDLRDNHDNRLVERWETFVVRFEEYNELCLKHVTNVAQQLVEESQVPDWIGGELRSGLKRGVNAAGLAAFIWARQLGINSNSLRIGGQGDTFQLTDGNTIVAVGTEQEMSRLLAVAKKLADDRSNITKLQETKSQKQIEQMMGSILRELKDFELSGKLRGHCQYIRI